MHFSRKLVAVDAREVTIDLDDETELMYLFGDKTAISDVTEYTFDMINGIRIGEVFASGGGSGANHDLRRRLTNGGSGMVTSDSWACKQCEKGKTSINAYTSCQIAWRNIPELDQNNEYGWLALQALDSQTHQNLRKLQPGKYQEYNDRHSVSCKGDCAGTSAPNPRTDAQNVLEVDFRIAEQTRTGAKLARGGQSSTISSSCRTAQRKISGTRLSTGRCKFCAAGKEYVDTVSPCTDCKLLLPARERKTVCNL